MTMGRRPLFRANPAGVSGPLPADLGPVEMGDRLDLVTPTFRLAGAQES